jgi:TorA maturation chaperone TorD
MVPAETEVETVTELRLEAAALRRDLYQILAAAFLAPPRVESVAALCQPETLDLLAAMFGEETVAPLRRHQGGVDEALRQEFFDLLAVPTGRYLTPFESVYCDRRTGEGEAVGGRLVGPSTHAVERVYEHHGFRLTASELPDHLGCELGFLGALWAREVEACQGGDEARAAATAEERRRFARVHPGRFTPELCRRLEAAATHDFLAGVARLTAALVAAEARGG